MGERTGEKYRPSNGSEGCWFMGKFCENCKHEKFSHTQKDGDKQCDILNRTMMHDVDDPEYPSEWTYTEVDTPTCTAFSFWNWRDKHTGELIEPEEPEPIDPNQAEIPFT